LLTVIAIFLWLMLHIITKTINLPSVPRMKKQPDWDLTKGGTHFSKHKIKISEDKNQIKRQKNRASLKPTSLNSAKWQKTNRNNQINTKNKNFDKENTNNTVEKITLRVKDHKSSLHMFSQTSRKEWWLACEASAERKKNAWNPKVLSTMQNILLNRSLICRHSQVLKNSLF